MEERRLFDMEAAQDAKIKDMTRSSFDVDTVRRSN